MTITELFTLTAPDVVLACFGQLEAGLEDSYGSVHGVNLSVDFSSGLVHRVIVAGSLDSSYQCVVFGLRIHTEFIAYQTVVCSGIGYSLGHVGSFTDESGNGEFQYELSIGSFEFGNSCFRSSASSDFILGLGEGCIERIHRGLAYHTDG